MQDQIDALRVEVDPLVARSSGLRVFDGDGNDVGLYAGFGGPKSFDFIYVFLEGTGITAVYDVNQGILGPVDPRFLYMTPDCEGPAYSGQAGVAGLTGPLAGGAIVAVTETATQEVYVLSRTVPGPRGEPVCALISPGPRHLVPVEFFAPQDSPVPTQLPPLLFVAPAE